MSIRVELNGFAEVHASPFAYVSRWSDPGAWRGGAPRDGDDVTIPANQTFLLDTSPARLGAVTVLGSLMLLDNQVASPAVYPHSS